MHEIEHNIEQLSTKYLFTNYSHNFITFEMIYKMNEHTYVDNHKKKYKAISMMRGNHHRLNLLREHQVEQP